MGEKTSTARARVLAGALALGLAAALAGCGGAGGGGRTAFSSGAHQEVTGVTPAQAREMIASDSTLLVLDVRDPGEWNDDLGHIERARLIPLSQLRGRVSELEPWRSRTIITVCRVGQRSHRAAEMLESVGFKSVHNLEGGMQAWRDAGY